MKKIYCLLLSIFFTIAAQAYDAKTNAPIKGAVVTLGNEVVRTGEDGTFHVDGVGETLKLRAPGYARLDFTTSLLSVDKNTIPLIPFKVKALYLSGHGVASHKLRKAALDTTK